mmetsp:Transcript_149423/g.261025  ORF Transcript_149423/g.261025 Transcript_149423/m.261025 type:complete len:386 (-) Transcript_149423:101-1258(-)
MFLHGTCPDTGAYWPMLHWGKGAKHSNSGAREGTVRSAGHWPITQAAALCRKFDSDLPQQPLIVQASGFSAATPVRAVSRCAGLYAFGTTQRPNKLQERRVISVSVAMAHQEICQHHPHVWLPRVIITDHQQLNQFLDGDLLELGHLPVDYDRDEVRRQLQVEGKEAVPLEAPAVLVECGVADGRDRPERRCNLGRDPRLLGTLGHHVLLRHHSMGEAPGRQAVESAGPCGLGVGPGANPDVRRSGPGALTRVAVDKDAVRRRPEHGCSRTLDDQLRFAMERAAHRVRLASPALQHRHTPFGPQGLQDLHHSSGPCFAQGEPLQWGPLGTVQKCHCLRRYIKPCRKPSQFRYGAWQATAHNLPPNNECSSLTCCRPCRVITAHPL